MEEKYTVKNYIAKWGNIYSQPHSSMLGAKKRDLE
jgi:hypothetical protein